VQDLSKRLKELNYDLDDLTGARAIFWAAKSGNLAGVRKLLDEGASSNSRDSSRTSALEHAAGRGCFELVELLIGRGAVATDQALQWAVGRGDIRIIEKLLEHGAKATSKDSYGVSPLFVAVSAGISVTPFLLDPLKNRPTPSSSPRDKYRDLIKLLIEKGADVNGKLPGSNYKSGFQTTPLTVAAAFGYDDIYQLLLTLGADPDIEDAMGRTAVEWKCTV